MINQSLLCQQYLNIVYQNAQTQYATHAISETYGEILYSGVDKLLSNVALKEQDVFVDLGSGLGKLLLQVFLKSSVGKAIGIELASELHQQALLAADKVQHELPGFFSNQRQLEFLQGNFLEIPFMEASVMLLGSPCFGVKLLEELGEIFNRVPGLHTVMSLRPIPNLQRLRFKKAIRVECSWDSALCYIYQ